MKLLKHDALMDIYNKAESVDGELFSEQRSNLLLVAGEHYSKRNAGWFNRIRDSKELAPEQKLRITKNHIHKISEGHVNNIVNSPVGITAVPNNPKEIQDQKAAQLNKSVLEYDKKKLRYSEKRIQYAGDFFNVGEVAVKIFFDPWAGDYLGPQEEVNPETGEVTTSPKFSGAMIWERIYGFNLLRSPNCSEIGVGGPTIIRKMVDTEELRAKVGDDPELLRFINQSEDKTYRVFDGAANGYKDTDGQTMLLEWYFPKSVDCPQGYFYIGTVSGVLWHGELPFGIWPIIYTGFQEIPTSPRHRSKIKQIRHYQVEINRAGSKIAEHQITLGDDKLLVSGGAKVSNGVQLPGVRTIQYSGAKPEYLAGRAGGQYLEYLNSQIAEMYQVAGMAELLEEKPPQGDLMQVLYQRIEQKKKHSLYLQKFQNWELRAWETHLELAKNYYTPEMLIPMIGKDEHVNMEEFRNTEKLCYQIKLEPHSEDIETMMGKQIVLNHAIQYVGPQLDKKSIGRVMRAMPFGNLDEAFAELTMDEDSANNMILALDRGRVPIPNRYDDGPYMIRKLTFRTRNPDFDLLHPKIQNNYKVMIRYYEDLEVEKALEQMRAQKGFIPTGGPRVKADLYVNNPLNPNKVEKATFSTSSLVWLQEQLAKQGETQEQLQLQNQGAVTEMATQLNQQQGANMEASQFGTLETSNMGPASPEGVLQ